MEGECDVWRGEECVQQKDALLYVTVYLLSLNPCFLQTQSPYLILATFLQICSTSRLIRDHSEKNRQKDKIVLKKTARY